METCKSPRKVLNAAYKLAAACLTSAGPGSAARTLPDPQLFACLVLREHQKKELSRNREALLKDCPEWCADIGLKKVPDHNTLCRAHRNLVKPGVVERMLRPVDRLHGPGAAALEGRTDKKKESQKENATVRNAARRTPQPWIRACSGVPPCPAGTMKNAASKASAREKAPTPRRSIATVPSSTGDCPSSPWPCMPPRI